MKRHTDMSLCKEEIERLKNEELKLRYLHQLTTPNDQIPPEIGIETLKLI